MISFIGYQVVMDNIACLVFCINASLGLFSMLVESLEAVKFMANNFVGKGTLSNSEPKLNCLGKILYVCLFGDQSNLKKYFCRSFTKAEETSSSGVGDNIFFTFFIDKFCRLFYMF